MGLRKVGQLRGYAARTGVSTNLTTKLCAWAVRTCLQISLARSFKKGYKKKKIGHTKTKVALLPSGENKKGKYIKNEERGGIAFSSSNFREKDSKGEQSSF